VRLTVPRRGGWRVWGAVRADFEHALAAPADPAITSAEFACELRRGAYVRVTLALTIVTTDVPMRWPLPGMPSAAPPRMTWLAGR